MSSYGFHAGVTLNGSAETGVLVERTKVELDSNNAQYFKPGFPYRGQVDHHHVTIKCRLHLLRFRVDLSCNLVHSKLSGYYKSTAYRRI